MIEIYITFK